MPDDIRNLKQLMTDSKFVLTPEAIGGQSSPSWAPPSCQIYCFDECLEDCAQQCAHWCHSPISYP